MFIRKTVGAISVLLLTAWVGACSPEQAAPESQEMPAAQPQAAASEQSLGDSLDLTPPPVDYRSDTDIGLLARVHFATHTVDFDRARSFYRALGYTQGVSGFPLTNTHEMALALGMEDVCQYELVAGEVIELPGATNPSNIDLLQFKTPFNDDPPYALPNHLGMAYAVFLTSDFDADVAALAELGAPTLGAPFGVAGSRFMFFKDPDGVLYKLEEAQGPAGTGAMNIFDMPYVAINVSDLEGALAFYARFGYEVTERFEQSSSASEEAAAYGLTGSFSLIGADVAITRGDQHRLRLQQWLEPFDSEPAYPPPINHIGINRLALVVPDIERAVSILKAQDVPFLSEPASCCSGTGEDPMAIVHAIDPDGVFLELVGGIEPRPLKPQPEGCPPLEIKYPQGASPPAG